MSLDRVVGVIETSSDAGHPRPRRAYGVPAKTSSQTRAATSAIATPSTATRRSVDVRRET